MTAEPVEASHFIVESKWAKNLQGWLVKTERLLIVEMNDVGRHTRKGKVINVINEEKIWNALTLAVENGKDGVIIVIGDLNTRVGSK